MFDLHRLVKVANVTCWQLFSHFSWQFLQYSSYLSHNPHLIHWNAQSWNVAIKKLKK